MKLSEIIKELNLEMDLARDLDINSLNTLEDSSVSALSFFENKKYLSALKTTKAGAVFIKQEFVEYVPQDSIAIITEEPYLKLALASRLFARPVIEDSGADPLIAEDCQIQPNVYLGKNSKIGKGVRILSGAFIGDGVEIGAGTIIYPNVTIYRDCKIGANTIIHAGSVIGSDGFGFAHTKAGEHVKIYQNGNVVIEDNVEIGANSCVDRAVFGSTLVKAGAKIDNLVQIGHNCIIGENAIIVSQVGISGSSILEENVVMGGQSATAGHLKIGAFTTIMARGGVTKSVPGGKVYGGFPLMEHVHWLKLNAKLAKLMK